METGCAKCTESIYLRCRKEAARYNDKLNSRENAADLLGVSPSSLANYELGITKFVPVDKVVLMADLYNAPELLSEYCATECPIGCRRKIGTEIKPIELTTVGLLSAINNNKLNDYLTDLIHIAADGKVSKDESSKLHEIVAYLNEIRVRVEELTLFDQKNGGSANA